MSQVLGIPFLALDHWTLILFAILSLAGLKESVIVWVDIILTLDTVRQMICR